MSTKPGWQINQATAPRPQSASIIVDNYNYASFVGKAIESALGQTCAAQVIVVDDGSTDGSRDVIRSFGVRIDAVFKSNGGQASALNAGFAKASGDIVIFLDADDMLEENAVASLLEVWRSETVMAHYPMTIIDSHGRPCGIIPGPPAQLSHGDVRNELLTTGGFASTIMSGMAFAHTALTHVMPMPEREFVYAADGYLLRAVAFLGPVQYVNCRLARYRVHGENDSNPLRASNGDLGAGFRKKIRYSQNQFDVTRKFARMFDLPVAPDLGEQDPDYLGYRLFSLLLRPADHPIPSDHRVDLLRRYVVRRWASSWPVRRRALAITVAVAAMFAKPSTAMTLIHLLHTTSSRPSWLRRLAQRITGGRPATLPNPISKGLPLTGQPSQSHT